MSLADELIADYEEGGDEFVDNDDDSHMEMAVADEAAIEHDRIQNSVRQVAKLSGSKEVSGSHATRLYSVVQCVAQIFYSPPLSFYMSTHIL